VQGRVGVGGGGLTSSQRMGRRGGEGAEGAHSVMPILLYTALPKHTRVLQNPLLHIRCLPGGFPALPVHRYPTLAWTCLHDTSAAETGSGACVALM
jgi:hypothetical protein